MYTEAPRLTGKDDPNAINKHLLIALAAFFLSFVCLFVCFVNFIFLSLSTACTLGVAIVIN